MDDEDSLQFEKLESTSDRASYRSERDGNKDKTCTGKLICGIAVGLAIAWIIGKNCNIIQV